MRRVPPPSAVICFSVVAAALLFVTSGPLQVMSELTHTHKALPSVYAIVVVAAVVVVALHIDMLIN